MTSHSRIDRSTCAPEPHASQSRATSGGESGELYVASRRVEQTKQVGNGGGGGGGDATIEVWLKGSRSPYRTRVIREDAYAKNMKCRRHGRSTKQTSVRGRGDRFIYIIVYRYT